MVHKPDWFTDGKVFVSYAQTVGINKDGNTLYVVDAQTGTRTDAIDDRVIADVDTLLKETSGTHTATSRWVTADDFAFGVPAYYDDRYDQALNELLPLDEFKSFTAMSLGQLIKEKQIVHRAGHGSPSADLRNGSIPYIKVSDIRAGQININPSNLVTKVVAEKFWKGSASGLKPFDLITPIRASKNIGEFALFMPGQEKVVLTKEMLIVRPTASSIVDSFYLFWALSLRAVREQWNRVIFMQTNREDVGSRALEIKVPWPTEKAAGVTVSQDFREYYQGVEELRTKFVAAIEKANRHHVFLGVAGRDQ
jgi:hypothetical protein